MDYVILGYLIFFQFFHPQMTSPQKRLLLKPTRHFAVPQTSNSFVPAMPVQQQVPLFNIPQVVSQASNQQMSVGIGNEEMLVDQQIAMFGNTTAASFPVQQQAVHAVQPQIDSLQQFLLDSRMLTAAVSGPQIEGDDRDRVVSCLNQLLAACGIGKGYYRRDAPPYEFTTSNPFYRLKAVGYNQLSRHKNSEGLVSLMLKVSITQLESAADRQKLIDAINHILRARPAPTATGFLAVQSTSSAVDAGIKIFTDLKSLVSHDENLTEVIINVNEYRRGIWNASDLYAELLKPERMNQLKQLINCEKIVPLMEVDRNGLDNYLKRPPLGFEKIWPQAIMENPDSERLVPFPIYGFEQLIQRQKQQSAAVSNQRAFMSELRDRVTILERDIWIAHNRRIAYKNTQKHLSLRLLRILATQTLIYRYGMYVDENEERLCGRYEILRARINAPDRLRSKIIAIIDTLRRDGDLLKQRAQLKRQAECAILQNPEALRRCLSTRQTFMEDLVGLLKANLEALNIMENNRNK